ncbi:MAG: CHRD domain-containing protein [Burkholderiaceae bacterium]|nr:CHRD domain-containing protein [Burkholderiaceae bacterium]
MHALPTLHRLAFAAAAAGIFALSPAFAQDMKVELSGKNEVPPVTTSASGEGMFSVKPDGAISGSVTTSGIDGTMAHIHEGAAGVNGPVQVPLTKNGSKWVVPEGTKLTEAQQKALKEGKLYVNVHSKEHPGGELRAQLK